MRKETAIGIADALVVAALIYTVLQSRDSIDEFRNSRRVGEVIQLRRRPSFRPSLLTENVRPSPRPSLAPASVVSVPTHSIEIASDLCGVFRQLEKPNLDEFDRSKLIQFLAESWPNDGSLELFRALREGDWAEVAEIGRQGGAPGAEELGLMARLNLFEQGENDAAGVSHWVGPPEQREFDELEAMKARDPANSFWPLAEAHLLARAGRASERELRIAEAASLPGYRNPVSSFYAETEKTALRDGDDRKFLAYRVLRSGAPILTDQIHRELMQDVGKSPDTDEMLKWVGKTIETSQFPETDSKEPFVQGAQGSLFEAVMGNSLARKAAGEVGSNKVAYDRIRARFLDEDELGMKDAVTDEACDEEKVHAVYETLRRRIEVR